jgi:hypothetical protein
MKFSLLNLNFFVKMSDNIPTHTYNHNDHDTTYNVSPNYNHDALNNNISHHNSHSDDISNNSVTISTDHHQQYDVSTNNESLHTNNHQNYSHSVLNNASSTPQYVISPQLTPINSLNITINSKNVFIMPVTNNTSNQQQLLNNSFSQTRT